MAADRNKTSTHFSSFENKIQQATTAPSEPVTGDFYYDTSTNKLYVYNSGWRSASFSTTTSTSTSTSTTSTSTSITTTSTSRTTTSTSRTTSTSISTSTSTTTTL